MTDPTDALNFNSNRREKSYQSNSKKLQMLNHLLF
jgi:hypothetical protein